MRRKDRELTNIEEVYAILKEEGVCRLALKDEPYPYILPLNYGVKFEDDQVILYFHSAMEGRKIDLLKKNPQVSFEIDRNHKLDYDEEKGSCTMLYESVIGSGDVSFVEGEEKVAGLRTILRQHGRGEDFVIKEPLLQRTACFKLIVKEMAGKRH